MAEGQGGSAGKGWGWLRQVQSTTQTLGQICTEGVGEAKRRLEENRPGIDQFVKNLGDNVQQGVKKVQEQQPGLDQLVRNIGDNVHKGVKNLQENMARDPWSSPPTAAEVASLDLVYINDRLIAMRLPVSKRPPNLGGGVAPDRVPPKEAANRVNDGNDIDVVAALFRSRHAGHYMVWNVSEEGYDYSMFEDQVLEFRFPGHPAPPLGMLFKICTSIESWTGADDKNVAAVHCLTGRGRTSTVLACYLAWIGEFSTPVEALQYVATRKGIPMERLTIPSQRRYVSYFTSVMEGVRPRSEPLLLRRVIMNTIPTFGTKGGTVIGPQKGAAAAAEEEAVAAGGEGETGALGCCPYLQVFKGGALIFTAAYRPTEGLMYPSASGSGEGQHETSLSRGGAGTGGDGMPWAYTSDDSIAFPVDCILQGDLLIRCRHLSPNGRRVSMFRAAFHTGYVPCGVLRLTKQQLDGACADDRFHQDFFLDLIFAPVESPSTSSNQEVQTTESGKPADGEAAQGGARDDAAIESETPGAEEKAAVAADGGDAENSAAARREGGLVVDVEAEDAFDSMLHRDAKFWEKIAARKERREAVLKAREAARAAGVTSESIALARAKASKQKDATAARLGGVRFSIDEDEAGHKSVDQWASSAGTDTSASATASSMSKPVGIDDDDLLAQLAEAEMDEDDLIAGAMPSASALPSSMSLHTGDASQLSLKGPDQGGEALGPGALTQSDPDQDEAVGGDQSVSVSRKGDDGLEQKAMTAPSAKPPAGKTGTLEDELSQLEELERELGIVGVSGGSTGGNRRAAQTGSDGGGTSVAGGDASKEDSFDMDNLDELEGYLESLAK